MEQPSFLRLLPDVAGRRVLDLGCGVGQLDRQLAEADSSVGRGGVCAWQDAYLPQVRVTGPDYADDSGSSSAAIAASTCS